MKKVDSYYQNETLSKRDSKSNNNGCLNNNCANHRNLRMNSNCARYKLKSNISSTPASSAAASSSCSCSSSLMAEAASIAMKVSSGATLAPSKGQTEMSSSNNKLNCYSSSSSPLTSSSKEAEIDSDKVTTKYKHIPKETNTSCMKPSAMDENTSSIGSSSANSSSGSGSSSRVGERASEDSPRKNNFSSKNIKSIIRELFEKCSSYNHNERSTSLNEQSSSKPSHIQQPRIVISSESSSSFSVTNDYVLCSAIIEYINENILNSNAKTTGKANTSDTLNDGLELLRQLFCQHFGIKSEKYTGKESLRKLFKDRRLDYDSFSRIFIHWLSMLSAVSEPTINIFEESDESDKSSFENSMSSSECLKRLSLTGASCVTHKPDVVLPASSASSQLKTVENKPDVPVFEATSSSYLSPKCCVKPHPNIASKQASHSSHYISATGDVSPTLIIRSTTLPKSASFSQLNEKRSSNLAKDTKFKNGIDLNIQVDASNSRSFNSGNAFSSLNDQRQKIQLTANTDLEMENQKLKQENTNLKLQVQMAEETNNQIVNDIESESAKSKNLLRRNEQLEAYLKLNREELEQMRKELDLFKAKSNESSNENQNLTIALKESQNKLTKCEKELLNSMMDLDTSQYENKKLVSELSKQKGLVSRLQKENSEIEQQLIEVNIRCSSLNEQIEQLNKLLLETKSEKETLIEKLDSVQANLAKSNSKLLTKTFLNEQIEYANNQKEKSAGDYTDDVLRNGPESFANSDTLNESESLINLYIAANINENTFHQSANEVNFYNERLKSNSLLSSHSDLNSEKKGRHSTVRKFLAALEQVKSQYDEISNKLQNEDSDVHPSLETLRKFLEKIFDCSFDSLSASPDRFVLKQRVESLIDKIYKLERTSEKLSTKLANLKDKLKSSNHDNVDLLKLKSKSFTPLCSYRSESSLSLDNENKQTGLLALESSYTESCRNPPVNSCDPTASESAQNAESKVNNLELESREETDLASNHSPINETTNARLKKSTASLFDANKLKKHRSTLPSRSQSLINVKLAGSYLNTYKSRSDPLLNQLGSSRTRKEPRHSSKNKQPIRTDLIEKMDILTGANLADMNENLSIKVRSESLNGKKCDALSNMGKSSSNSSQSDDSYSSKSHDALDACKSTSTSQSNSRSSSININNSNDDIDSESSDIVLFNNRSSYCKEIMFSKAYKSEDLPDVPCESRDESRFKSNRMQAFQESILDDNKLNLIEFCNQDRNENYKLVYVSCKNCMQKLNQLLSQNKSYHRLKSCKSMPSLVDVQVQQATMNEEMENLLKRSTKIMMFTNDASTQTMHSDSGVSFTEDEKCSSFRRRQPCLLKQQLTRDSGIDSDHMGTNSHQKLSTTKSKRQQIVLSNRMRESENDDSSDVHKPADDFNEASEKASDVAENVEIQEPQEEAQKASVIANVSSSKLNLNCPKSLTIKPSCLPVSDELAKSSTNSSIAFMSSSTRDNSIDHDYLGQNTSSIEDYDLDHDRSHDEDDDVMVNLFKRNVVDEDEEREENGDLEDELNDHNIETFPGHENETNQDTVKSLKKQQRSFDIASNKRKLFKESCQRHHTIAVASDEPFKTGKEAESLRMNISNNRSLNIDSSKPVVNCTLLSRVAERFKKNEEKSRLAKDLTIDEVLNIIDSPTQSMYYSYGQRPSRPSFSNISSGHHTPYQMPVNYQTNVTRSSAFKSPQVNSRSISQSSSFDEHHAPFSSSSSSSASSAELEHRLKLLETCFNQIAMAHHSDQQLVQSCIEIYKEKYQKADKYMNLLFDEMNASLNKIVNCLNENSALPAQKKSNPTQRRSSRYSISEQMSINDDYPFMNEMNNSYDVFGGSTGPFDDALMKSINTNELICISKRDKKYMQENLNMLNKTMTQLRKNIISLITSSSMISGLKQEAHLGELVQISISYVRELRRSILNANKVTSNTMRSLHFREPPLLKRSMSIQQNTNTSQLVPKSSSSSFISSKAGFSDRPPMNTTSRTNSNRSVFGRNRFRSMTIPENDREEKTSEIPKKKSISAQKRRNSWFTSISIIKSFSSNSISPFLRGKDSPHDSMDVDNSDLSEVSQKSKLPRDDSSDQTNSELNMIHDSSEELANEAHNGETYDTKSSGFSECEQSEIIDHLCTNDTDLQDPRDIEDDGDLKTSEDQESKELTEQASGEFDWSVFIVQACYKTSNLVRYGVEKLGVLSTHMRRVPELISKDSFRYLRYMISAMLLVFSLTFFLLTLFQERDIYERIFHILIENIEIKNPKNAARPV